MTSTVAGPLHVVRYPAQGESRCDTAVVLLHGIGGSVASCAPLAQWLAAVGIPSWCADAPGYGASPDPRPGVDVVDDVIEQLDELSEARPAVLVGTSWGGVVAASVALRRPDRVAGLVLADSTRGSGTTPQKAMAMRARIEELADSGAHAVAMARAPRLVAPTSDPLVVDAVRTAMAGLRTSGFAAAAEFMASTDLGPRLAEIACPTMVLVGEYDTVTGVDEARLLAERIPGAQLHIIADAGHVAIQEQPIASAALIADFVKGLP